jgi:glycosyltransferase involved in cell wall biosynthesis
VATAGACERYDVSDAHAVLAAPPVARREIRAKRGRVCFFAKVQSREELQRVEFYAQDVRALEELGYEVVTAVRPSELRVADVYVAWWWTWAFLPVSFAHVLGRPVIVTGVFDHWKYPTRPWAHRALHRYALGTAAANVFVSQLEYSQVPSELRVRNPRYAPLAIDGDVYHPGRLPREDFILTTAKMARGNGRRKCIEEIIRAVPLVRAIHPRVRFVMAGELDPAYPALTRELGVDDVIDFPGVVDREAKVRLMQRCQLYLQPSRFEGFGLAIAEAMACGAPIVTSDAGAVREVVGDHALFVNGEDPTSIADGVTALLAAPARQAELSAAGARRITAEFSFERHKRDWASILESVL